MDRIDRIRNGQRPAAGPACCGLLSLILIVALAGCYAAQPLREPSVSSGPSDGAWSLTEAFGDSSGGPKVELRDGLTEQEAVALALRRSPSLSALRHRREAAKGEIGIARALPNPEFRVGDLRAGRLRSLFPGEDDSFIPFQGVDLGARWSLPYPAVMGARIRAARHGLEEAEAELEGACSGLAARVRLLHAAASALEEEVRLAVNLVDLRRRQRDLTSRAVERMSATVLDEGAAQLEYLEAVAEVERLHLTRQETLRELSALLRLPEADTLRVVATVLSFNLTLRDDAALIREAFSRADLRAMRARHAQADARVAEAYGGRIPWPGYLQVSYELAGRQDPGGWEIGLGIELPLLNWGTAKVRRLEAERATREAEFEARTGEVASEVRRVLGRLRACARGVALYRDEILPAVELSLDQTRRAVEAGQADQRRLLAVQERALKERRAYLEALLGYQQSLIELDRATGKGDGG